MNKWKLGLGSAAVGTIMLLSAHYITIQVEQGKLALESAQSKVKSTNELFSKNPLTEPFGEEVTRSGQQKLDAGRAAVEKYESIITKLQIGGLILIVTGVAIFFLYKRKSN
jgi:hypothetical protein